MHCKFYKDIILPPPCDGIRQVECVTHIGCEKCGWNPEVEQERKRQLRENGKYALIEGGNNA